VGAAVGFGGAPTVGSVSRTRSNVGVGATATVGGAATAVGATATGVDAAGAAEQATEIQVVPISRTWANDRLICTSSTSSRRLITGSAGYQPGHVLRMHVRDETAAL